MLSPMNTAKLTKRLRETIAWCGRLGVKSPRDLRTLAVELYPFCNRHHMVEAVAALRVRALGRAFDDRPLSDDELKGGRVLAFEPDLYLHEQWEEEGSGGFLDRYCTPPTDTWLIYLDDAPGTLLSWVPAAYVEPVQHAININTSSCIRWFDATC